VGIMPDWQPGSTERRPALYLEVRHDGTPVNPMPYLRVTG
jgi:septal ring factor EnvC (AmiA/AmiB activator)